MNKLLGQLAQVAAKCERHSTDLEGIYGPDNPRTACLSSIYNRVNMTGELLHYYRTVSSQPQQVPPQDQEQLIEEIIQRRVEATKWLFVAVMSTVEFYVKQCIDPESHPLADCVERDKRLRNCFDKAYKSLDDSAKRELKAFRKLLNDTPPFDAIRRIIDQSAKHGFLTNRGVEVLGFSVELRNITVHNNANGSRDMSLTINGETLQLIKGQMTRGPIGFYTLLVSELVDHTTEWLKRL